MLEPGGGIPAVEFVNPDPVLPVLIDFQPESEGINKFRVTGEAIARKVEMVARQFIRLASYHPNRQRFRLSLIVMGRPETIHTPVVSWIDEIDGVFPIADFNGVEGGDAQPLD